MWSSVEIAGKSADVFDPPGGARPRFAVLFLHPIGQETLRGQPVYTRLLEEHRLGCVCPPGGYTWWADRVLSGFDPSVTAEKYLLKHVMPFINQRWQLAPPAIGLLGISMGGQGALRLAFKHPQTFPVVAGIASALDHYELYGRGLSLDEMYDSKEQCRQDGALLHVHPSQFPPHIFFTIDPADADWQRGNDRLHEKMAALGVPHTCDLTTRASSHSWDYFNRLAEPALTFLVEGLEKESRRLM